MTPVRQTHAGRRRAAALRSIAAWRLRNQQVVNGRCTTPKDVVAHLGAMQAQDYAGAKWSIGLRLPASTDEEIETAIAAKTIVRTWPQRGTLHFVAADDVRWMLGLLAPRTIAGSALRRSRLELDDRTLKRSFAVLEKTLRGRAAARPEVMAALERAGIATAENRGYHILWQAALSELICFGPMQRKQQSFVLLDEWVPAPDRRMERGDALAELASRYFRSRGPATLKDLIWWSGLTAGDARQALESVKNTLHCETIDGVQYWMPSPPSDMPASDIPALLLPGFDEYLLGYADRSAVLDPAFAARVVPGGGMFHPTAAIDGRIVGTWKRVVQRKEAFIDVTPFGPLTRAQLRALDIPAQKLSAFTRVHHEVRSPG